MLSGPNEKKKLAVTSCFLRIPRRAGIPSRVPRNVSASIRKPKKVQS